MGFRLIVLAIIACLTAPSGWGAVEPVDGAAIHRPEGLPFAPAPRCLAVDFLDQFADPADDRWNLAAWPGPIHRTAAGPATAMVLRPAPATLGDEDDWLAAKRVIELLR